MILFLDFTPVEFMGGTEKWMNDTAKKINKYENTKIISMHPKIANLYGIIVANRRYEKRVKRSEIHNHMSLDFYAFIPHTRKWKDIKEHFSKSRIIYIKYDILEIIIILYFLGTSGLKKTVTGFLSPFIYHHPLRFFDHLHNIVYTSKISRNFLKKLKRVHVINSKDKLFLETKFLLKNAVYVPLGVKIYSQPKIVNKVNALRVLFIGELSERKGVDILIDVIKNSPAARFQFDITSDGPLKKHVHALANSRNNCTYHGYVSSTKKQKLYEQADVLILPSRGEGFPLVILDAMSQGLRIVDSTDIRLDLPNYVEYSSENNSPEEYLDILEKIYRYKRANDLKKSKKRIFDYCNKTFSERIILPRLINEIFAERGKTI